MVWWVAILALLFLSWGTALRSGEQVKDSPYAPLKVGTKWVYRFGEEKITVAVVKHEKIGNVLCALLESTSDGKVVLREHVAVAADGVYSHALNGTKTEPPLLVLSLPSKKGASWKIDSKVGGKTWKGTLTLDEAEVKVPAGTYKALVVRSDDLEIAGTKASGATWYASGVGMVRQTLKQGGREALLELEKFEAPK
jgi:hypothetical protein